MKTTIDMAREAGAIHIHERPKEFAIVGNDSIKAFEALVRADEQEKYKWDIHSCGPTCKRYACVAMREAVEAEREACAKVCEGATELGCEYWSDVAEAIRERSANAGARGNQ
jgi:hypothetical protein